MKHFLRFEEKNCQPRIIYPAKIYCRNETKSKIVSKEEELREFVASRHSLKT